MGSPSDTIIARATAPGTGAIAIVRLSGSKTAAIVERSFRRKTYNTDWKQLEPHRLYLGYWLEGETEIDEVQLVCARTPNSYTGEDLCEVHCHGSSAVIEHILQSGLSAGARLAEPGEFTKRAYLNGRMDLSQAEAVCDLISASTESARILALQQVGGGVSDQIKALRERLINVAAEVEARLDFSDEDIGEVDVNRVREELRALRDDVANRLNRNGQLVSEGARVVICGRPNTGKSSLLNALAGRERALVTPHEGTTRDTIECTLDIEGYEFNFIDTAGLRDASDPVERLGIERAVEEVKTADLILWMLDSSQAFSEDDKMIADKILQLNEDLKNSAAPIIAVLNKADLPNECGADVLKDKFKGDVPTLSISVVQSKGLEVLEASVLDTVIGPRQGAMPEGALISNVRQLDLLRQVKRCLGNAYKSYLENTSGEFIMVDLNEAVAALSEILGLEVDEAVLDRIFQKFCIGK